MSLKESVFFRAKAALDALREAKGSEGYTTEECNLLENDYLAIHQIIEEAEIEQEFKAWIEEN